MEAGDVINLFDSLWFYPKTFLNSFNTPTPEHPLALAVQNQVNSGRQRDPTQLNIHSRSRSHDHIIIMKRDTSFSPDSSSLNPVLSKPHLETIVSQKEISPEIPRTRTTPQMKKPFRKTRKGSSKSLSELEFEELKGFMDLGFVFSEEDKNSSLADIIPGLQRFGQRNDCEVEDETICGDGGVEEFGGSRARPYLSEAWEILEKENREINRLTNWRVPVVSNEIVMKDSLKLWAHAVASAVR